MPTTADRHPLNAYLSADAYDGWRMFAISQRVTVTALVEAVGLCLATMEGPRLPGWLREVVATAAEVDAERRSRRPG